MMTIVDSIDIFLQTNGAIWLRHLVSNVHEELLESAVEALSAGYFKDLMSNSMLTFTSPPASQPSLFPGVWNVCLERSWAI